MQFWNPSAPLDPRRFPVHYGWVIAVVGCLGMIASVPGQTIGVNVFNEKLIVALQLTRTQVSAAYLVGTALSGFALPFAGSLFDRWGARRMMALASVGLSLSLGLISGVDFIAAGVARLLSLQSFEFWIRWGTLAAAFLLIRFWGQGMVMMTSRNMIGKWWVAHRGKVFSIGGIAVSVCFSLSPRFFDWLIESIGWREAWWVIALALAPFFCVLAWMFFRDNPQECGLDPDAGKAAPQGQSSNPEFRIAKEFQRGEALRSYSFWAFSLVFAMQACYVTGYTFHVVDVAGAIGVSKEWILNLFFPVAVLSSCISLFVGWACDRWRLKFLLAFMAFGNVLAPLSLLWANQWLLPILLVIGFGIGGGSFGALSGAFPPRFFGLKHLGAISGFFTSLLVVGSAFGPMLFSLSKAWWGNYDLVHALAGAGAAVLLVMALFANNPQRALLDDEGSRTEARPPRR